MVGQQEAQVLEAVDIALEAPHGAEDGGWLHIGHLAPGAHHIALDGDHKRVFLNAAGGERGLVHEGQMGEIHEIIDDELPVGFHQQMIRLRRPTRPAVFEEVGDQRGVGLRRITHPDIDQRIALDDRIDAGSEAIGHGRLRGDQLAAAIRAKAQPVIAAFDLVMDELAFGERILPVRAAIRQGDGASILAAPEHDGLAADHAREGLAVQLVGACADIPLVLQKLLRAHGPLPVCAL